LFADHDYFRRPDISDDCPPAFRSLIHRCWQNDPLRRPRFGYIVRYLKEELARVQRNRAMSVTRPGGNLLTGLLSPYTLGIPSAPVTPYKEALNSSPQEKEKYKKSTQESSYRKFLSWSFKRREESTEYEDPLLSSALCSNGSLLSEHLLAADANLSNEIPVDVYRAKDKDSNSAGGSAATCDIKAKTQWRDRYVMRFSGWKASQPDTGLPPSLITSPAAVTGTLHENIDII